MKWQSTMEWLKCYECHNIQESILILTVHIGKTYNMWQRSYMLRLQRCIVQIVQQMLKFNHFSILGFLCWQVNSEWTLSKKRIYSKMPVLLGWLYLTWATKLPRNWSVISTESTLIQRFISTRDDQYCYAGLLDAADCYFLWSFVRFVEWCWRTTLNLTNTHRNELRRLDSYVLSATFTPLCN